MRILLAIFIFLSITGFTRNFTYDQIADAIYHAEGGVKAKKPYGILSVRCDDEEECRKICINTIRNNWRRFKEGGHGSDMRFLEFLQRRYAPIGAENDPSGLNHNWLRLVEYFLKNPKRINNE